MDSIMQAYFQTVQRLSDIIMLAIKIITHVHKVFIRVHSLIVICILLI